MTDVLDASLDLYRRHRFLEEANEAYSKLAESPVDYKSYLEEMESVEGTSSDGFGDLQHDILVA